MGIREYLDEHKGEMKLSDFNTDVEEGEDDLEFDAEREISDKEWEIMKNELASLRGRNWDSFLSLAMNLKIAFPDRVDELGLHIAVFYAARENIKEYKKLVTGSNNKLDMAWWSICAEAAEIKELFPNEYEDLNITAADINGMEAFLRSLYESDDSSDLMRFCYIAKYFKFIAPQRLKHFDLDGVFDKLKEILSKTKEEGDWPTFAQQAAAIKIVYPNRAKELGIDKKTFLNMRERIDYMRRGDFLSDSDYRRAFAGFIARMKILAAKDVRVADEGLELMMQDNDFKQEKSKRPERLEF